jgi:hypothetical protein
MELKTISIMKIEAPIIMGSWENAANVSFPNMIIK